MSSLTLANLRYIDRDALAARLRTTPATEPTTAAPAAAGGAAAGASPASGSIAVIDVRDDDFIGGHIAGATNVPSTSLDYRMPELVRMLNSKGMVVFHCALSQQRGPAAALRYMRERERLLGAKATSQEVVVLDGGFNRWQEKYGEDEQITENYDKGLWEFGMS